MNILKITGKVIIFPFKFLFGRRKKDPGMQEMPSATYQPQYQAPAQMSPQDMSSENTKAKMDLVLTQIDSLKIEYETINQRIQNIERMVRELYAMAKS